MADGSAAVAAVAVEEDILRGRFYRLMARLLLAPPSAEFLAQIAELESDDTEIGRALFSLAGSARRMTASEVADEYHCLFIGIARGELVPYGSYYLTGFLNEKPLARLRQDLARLGIARADHVAEPEDHIGTLFEVMAGLIAGEFGAPASLHEQHRLFKAHIEPWAARFFADLEAAPGARFYGSVGRLGRAFTAIEVTGFEMAA